MVNLMLFMAALTTWQIIPSGGTVMALALFIPQVGLVAILVLAIVRTARVNRRINPKHAQIFDLYALRHWSAAKTARELGVSVVQVYLVNHRLTRLLKDEVSYLQKKLE